MGKNGKHRFLGKSTGGFFEVYESTGLRVFFLGGECLISQTSQTGRTGRTSPTNQMEEHPIKLPKGDGIVLTSLIP